MHHPTLKLKIHEPDHAISVDGRAVEVCEEHFDVLVVRDADLLSTCPLCEALEMAAKHEANLAEAMENLEYMERELDGAYDEINELSAEVDSLNATIGEFENVVDEPIRDTEI